MQKHIYFILSMPAYRSLNHMIHQLKTTKDLTTQLIQPSNLIHNSLLLIGIDSLQLKYPVIRYQCVHSPYYSNRETDSVPPHSLVLLNLVQHSKYSSLLPSFLLSSHKNTHTSVSVESRPFDHYSSVKLTQVELVSLTSGSEGCGHCVK
jgi:hypothetical protein